jgi:hypothetical protein
MIAYTQSFRFKIIFHYATFSLLRLIITTSTTGAPNTAVTVLILSSVGANMVLANKSQNRQNTLPPRKQAGIIRIGFVLPNRLFTR